MRRLTVLMLAAVFWAGCTSHTPAPSVNSGDAGMAAPPHTAPTDNPVSDKPPVIPEPDATTRPYMIDVNHAELKPYFQAATSSFTGVFLAEGEDLFYSKDGVKVHVLKGPHPSALAKGSHGVLVTDGTKVFWFNAQTRDLQAIAELPAAYKVAAHGDTYLLAGDKKVMKWTPGTAPVELAKPDHLFAVYGVSISPDGRYGVVAYDLDIPQGPRAGVIWAFDLQSGAVVKWPTEEPKYMDGLWLLGWSDPHTIRFMTGQRGFNTGHTWALPGGNPQTPDGSEYRDGEHGWSSSDGAWVIYCSSVQDVLLQSMHPGSKPILVYRSDSGVDYGRVLLNGHLAFRTRAPAAWWEITAEGTVVRWDDTDALY